ncbi:glycosyltransferase [Candidatus Fonsibacter ubiquis]|uniref:glycosyltransferase n=1 Tax=Candidatus Fonsibacter ubiquis TaxID=1925548 RepID=UPI000C078EBD|nr:glycosyltransferase [Candidatus Fonsibacter ubiquis]
MKVFYWSPFTSKVATITAVINSAESLQKFSNNKIKSHIINVFGEWNDYVENIKNKNIKLIYLSKFDFRKFLFCTGFIRSRLSYIFIYFYYFFLLLKILKKDEPNFLVIHLITSLPLTLLALFNFKTKFILRISGYPKLNFIRKIFWKLLSKKIYKITFPTKETYKLFVKLKIFDINKMLVVYDPVLDINIINKKKSLQIKDIINKNSQYILSVGRFTKQKNFEFLIKSFSEISKKYPSVKLVIIGKGELKEKYQKLLKDLNLNEQATLLEYQENIYQFISKSICVVIVSLWEDPGFVMIESAATNTVIISSDCPSGPKEFIDNNSAGYLFKTNDQQNFLDTFDNFMTDSKDKIIKKKISAKRNANAFTRFRHYKAFSQLLN